MPEEIFDKSIFTSKANDLSTIANESSYHSFQPIHSLSQSYFRPVFSKRSPPKPAFGTSSNRQIKQLKGIKQTDIVAYSRITYQKNQKYQDRYEQIQPKLTPFLTTSARFSNNKKHSPGPGAYKFPQIFNNQTQLKKNHNHAMFSPFKKWQAKERKQTGKSYEVEKDHFLMNEKQNIGKIDKNLQQRIKQKREEMKQKMSKLKQMMKKPQTQLKQDFKRMGYSVDTINQQKPQIQQNNDKIESGCSPTLIAPNFKQITKKYLPKKQYAFERQEYRTGSEMKSFIEKYNNQAVFLKGNENPFSSYINKSETPGPGYYDKRTKKLHKKEFKECHKFFL